MDYYKEYKEAKEWHRKVCIMHLFHTAQCMHDTNWTLNATAKFFDVSIGLVSENIRLAKQLDERPELMKASNRQEALDMEKRKYTRYRINHIKHEDEDEDE